MVWLTQVLFLLGEWAFDFYRYFVVMIPQLLVIAMVSFACCASCKVQLQIGSGNKVGEQASLYCKALLKRVFQMLFRAAEGNFFESPLIT